MNAHQIVEAVLFATDAPLSVDEIARADEMLDEDQVEDALQLLRAEYDDAGRSFQVVEVAEGYQILTRPEYAPYLERFDNVPRPSKLSGPSVETLAIIAYRQPIGRLEVEYIRGVGASGVIRTLQDRRLIDVVGRSEGLGRPLLYGTTPFFLEHFGFKSLEDLPRPEELPIVLRERIPLGLDGDGEEGSDAEGADPNQGELAIEGAVEGDGSESATDEDGPAGQGTETGGTAGEAGAASAESESDGDGDAVVAETEPDAEEDAVLAESEPDADGQDSVTEIEPGAGQVDAEAEVDRAATDDADPGLEGVEHESARAETTESHAEGEETEPEPDGEDAHEPEHDADVDEADEAEAMTSADDAETGPATSADDTETGPATSADDTETGPASVADDSEAEPTSSADDAEPEPATRPEGR